MLDRRRVRIGDRDHERAVRRGRQADHLGPLVSLADLRVERRDAGSGRQRDCEQSQRRAALLLPPGADHAVGRAGSDDRGIGRQVGERVGQIVRRLAVLGRAEERDQVGQASRVSRRSPPMPASSAA